MKMPIAMRILVGLWIMWFAIYFITGAYAKKRHRTSFLAGTVDRVESFDLLASSWVKLTLLNITLQLVLAPSAAFLATGNRLGVRRAGMALACLVTALIIGHLLVSIVTELPPRH